MSPLFLAHGNALGPLCPVSATLPAHVSPPFRQRSRQRAPARMKLMMGSPLVVGVGTFTSLPLDYDTIKAGDSKQVTLQFRNVAAGAGTLVVNGSSASGPIYASLPVTVP